MTLDVFVSIFITSRLRGKWTVSVPPHVVLRVTCLGLSLLVGILILSDEMISETWFRFCVTQLPENLVVGINFSLSALALCYGKRRSLIRFPLSALE